MLECRPGKATNIFAAVQHFKQASQGKTGNKRTYLICHHNLLTLYSAGHYKLLLLSISVRHTSEENRIILNSLDPFASFAWPLNQNIIGP